MLELVQRRCVLLAGLSVVVRNDLFDLARPVNDSRLKSLEQVLVSDCRINVRNVFLRDVELSAAFAGRALFRQGSHKLVQVGLELLLNTVGPLVFAVEFGNVFVVHFVQQVIKWISIDLASHHLMVDLTEDDWVFAASFNEVANLILLRRYIQIEELWG